jgi:pimeloyl-ACP methyl ester carboxylesterase
LHPHCTRRACLSANPYLDLAAELKLENAVLVGAFFGGWIGAEMMVRSSARFSHLVLVDPLGIKISGREKDR